MIDNPFRQILPKYIHSLLKFYRALHLHPNHISVLGFIIALGAAYCVYRQSAAWAIGLWWLSRLLDGTDGIYARHYGLATKFGAFLDIQLDMAAYAIMVVAFLLSFPQFQLQWVLMLVAYILCITGALSLGSFEQDIGLQDSSGRGLQLAAGLAEGGETGIAYTLFLLFPQWLNITTWVWVAVLALTIVARLLLARRELQGAN